MKPRNSGVLEHEVAEIQSAEHVSSFLEHVEFVDDGTVLQNFKVELMARSGAPLFLGFMLVRSASKV